MGTLKQNWWIMAFQGFFLIAIGALAAFKVVLDINSLVSYLGLIFLIFGVIIGLLGWRARSKGGHWLWMTLSGLLETALGLIILAYPTDSTVIFIKVIGGFALLIGLIQLILGITARQNKLMLFINALLSVAFGIVIIWNPFDATATLTFVVGFYSIILGIGLIYYSVRIRNWSAARMRKAEEKQLQKEQESGQNDLKDLPGSGN